jgi:hypothetical protein
MSGVEFAPGFDSIADRRNECCLTRFCGQADQALFTRASTEFELLLVRIGHVSVHGFATLVSLAVRIHGLAVLVFNAS